jgi:hypothetical protein
MAIELKRRAVLAAFGGLLCSPLSLRAAQAIQPLGRNDPSQSNVLAAWKNLRHGGYEVGLLQLSPHRIDHGLVIEPSVQVRWALTVPSRPHGLTVLADGCCLVAARRPGDWLMKVSAQGKVLARTWLPDDRRLNGHVLAGNHAGVFYSTETNLENDQGLVVLRDVQTLEPVQEWETHGRDPHEMLLVPPSALGRQAPCLMVANGGVKSLPNFGRQPLSALGRVEPLDSSLVALDLNSGVVLQTWHLEDPWLSLRHLAYHETLDAVGVALQAHHPDVALKQEAPIVAVLSSKGLECGPSNEGFSGYGGSIVAGEHGFMVTSPLANALAEFDVHGQLVRQFRVSEACALSYGAGLVWVGNAGLRDSSALELDNHWVVQPFA